MRHLGTRIRGGLGSQWIRGIFLSCDSMRRTTHFYGILSGNPALHAPGWLHIPDMTASRECPKGQTGAVPFSQGAQLIPADPPPVQRAEPVKPVPGGAGKLGCTGNVRSEGFRGFTGAGNSSEAQREGERLGKVGRGARRRDGDGNEGGDSPQVLVRRDRERESERFFMESWCQGITGSRNQRIMEWSGWEGTSKPIQVHPETLPTIPARSEPCPACPR